MLFNSLKASSGYHVMITFKEEDIKEVEVEYVLAHLAVDKILGWDDILNEFFKPFVLEVKGPLEQ